MKKLCEQLSSHCSREWPQLAMVVVTDLGVSRAVTEAWSRQGITAKGVFCVATASLALLPPPSSQVIQQALHRQPSTAAQYLQQMYAAQQQHLMLQTAALQQQHLSSAQLQSLAAVQQVRFGKDLKAGARCPGYGSERERKQAPHPCFTSFSYYNLKKSL